MERGLSLLARHGARCSNADSGRGTPAPDPGDPTPVVRCRPQKQAPIRPSECPQCGAISALLIWFIAAITARLLALFLDID